MCGGKDKREPKRRLFFALWPPAETAAALAAWAGEARAATGGRVTRAEAIHLTLAFLGEVSEGRVGAAIRAAKRVRADPQVLPIEQAGYWPHNRILWVGPRETPAALGSLARSLRAELEGEGFTIERRPFAVHITLIRKARAPLVLPALPTAAWPVREIALVRSVLSSSGSKYEVLQRFPIRAGTGTGCVT